MAHVQMSGAVLKAVGSVCEKSEETGDKHKSFVHVKGHGDFLTMEATNGAVVVQLEDADAGSPDGIACVVPRGTLGRIHGNDDVSVDQQKNGAHKLKVEKETDSFERFLEKDTGGEKHLVDPYPDLAEKFADLPADSGGFDVHPDNLLAAARVASRLKCNRVTIRTAKKRGAHYAYLVGYVGDSKTVRIAVGCLDMFGAPETETTEEAEDGGLGKAPSMRNDPAVEKAQAEALAPAPTDVFDERPVEDKPKKKRGRPARDKSGDLFGKGK